MILCPKCGNENQDNSMNCSKCRINLRYAIANLEKLKAQWQGEGDNQTDLDSRATKIICTTAPWLEGYRVTETLDVITAECVFDMNIIRDFLAGVRDIVGGRSGATQKVLRDARKNCLWELRKEAAEIGADAVIAINLDYNEFSGKNMAMLFLVASGTAVRIESISKESK